MVTVYSVTGSDETGNIQNGYYVPLVCFAAIILFGLSEHRIKKRK